MRNCNLMACCLLLATLLPAQTQKSWEISLLDTTPELDGKINDSCWSILPPMDAFTTSTPVFGEQPHCQTEVRLFYTQTALFVAARCYDPDSAGVRRDGSIRDAYATGDWFRISLDTWNDDQLAFNFTVTAAGVQLDNRQGGSGWDATWFSAVQPFAGGWDVEICIPFTALRFPKKMEHVWGAQFSRYDRSTGELSTWNPQDPMITDRVIQFGTLTGIRDIRQLKRRSLAVASESAFTFELRHDDPDATQLLGVDARVGLSESATLDFTLLPPRKVKHNFDPLKPADFSDAIQFISPTPLPEPRQFLEEERDLFDKHAWLNYNPEISAYNLLWRWEQEQDERIYRLYNSQILQASKLSARPGDRWRFGVYNALLGPTTLQYTKGNSEEKHREYLQTVSDYLVFATEYLLPNNGFVHISNSALLAGQGMNDLSPQLQFRLRNRNDDLEVAGYSRFVYQDRLSGKSMNNSWNASIARVNRRWGWSVNHSEFSGYHYPA